MRNFAFLLLLTFLCSSIDTYSQDVSTSYKFKEVIDKVSRYYVDETDAESLTETAIVALLEELDPHSTYIPEDELKAAQTSINGSFVGVGIRFQIMKDTLNVVATISGGPAEKLGMLPGDKIVIVDGENIAGTGLKNSDVREKLLGEMGSKVKVEVQRRNSNKNLVFNYASSWSTAFVFEQHLKFEKQFGGLEVRTSLNKVVNENSKKRLRIGYVSPDFRTHSVAYFFEPLLENHTSTTVETFCYYNGTKIDDTTRRLTEYSDHWRSVVGVSDADVVELIKNDPVCSSEIGDI